MRFPPDDDLLAALERWRDARRAGIALRAEGATSGGPFDQFARGVVAGMCELEDEVSREHDAFLLDPGLGPMTYLTADGRVLLDFRTVDSRTGWGDEVREATEDEAIGALVVGARKTGIARLLDLIPAAPEGGRECPGCRGERLASPAPGMQKFICNECMGRGWVV